MAQLTEFVINHWVLWVAFVLVLIMLVMGELQQRRLGLSQLGPNDAIRVMNRDNALLLDVREDKEFTNGYIANATHIPLSQLDSRLQELDGSKDRPIIAYCRSGSRSNKAGSILRKHGFATVYNLAGGILAWESANLPVTKK